MILLAGLLLAMRITVVDAPLTDPGENVRPASPTATNVAVFLGGAAAAFLAHESGHVIANLAYGNVPRLVGLKGFGFIPFFAISPDLNCRADACTTRLGQRFAAGRRGKYVISTAGFTVGNISSEIILSVEPYLRYVEAPFRTGWLAFNIALAMGYAISSVAGIEAEYGDAAGSSEVAHLDRAVFATLLVAPAFLDAYRYWWPGSVWAPWVSRGSKAAMLGVAFAL